MLRQPPTPEKIDGLFSVGNAQDFWFANLLANTNTLDIRKPEREFGLPGFKFESGTLRFSRPLQGVQQLRYPFWNLSAPYEKGKGWTLTVGMRDNVKARFKPVPFGFWSRLSGHDLPVWVNRVNRRLLNTLGPK